MSKQFTASLILLIVFWPGIVQACSIQNREETEIGPNRAIRGVCSTDRRPIMCEFKGGEGTSCTGPAGSFTGLDLNGLISSACACSFYQNESQEQGQITTNGTPMIPSQARPGIGTGGTGTGSTGNMTGGAESGR